MCLSELIGKRTLKHDRKVWKSMKVITGTEFTDDRGYIIKKGLNTFDTSVRISISTHIAGTVPCYNSGSHCFLRKKDAKAWCSSEARPLSYIIPAGTEVQFGIQVAKNIPRKVVVTPVLFNPR